MFAALPVTALILPWLGGPPWLVLSGFFAFIGATILAHFIVVCPYCGTFDPVGWMSGSATMLGSPRTKCPTCRARMDKPLIILTW